MANISVEENAINNLPPASIEYEQALANVLPESDIKIADINKKSAKERFGIWLNIYETTKEYQNNNYYYHDAAEPWDSIWFDPDQVDELNRIAWVHVLENVDCQEDFEKVKKHVDYSDEELRFRIRCCQKDLHLG